MEVPSSLGFFSEEVKSGNPLAAFGGVSPFGKGENGTLPLVEEETPPKAARGFVIASVFVRIAFSMSRRIA